MIEHDDPEMSVLQQALLLDINRSTLYYRPIICDPQEVALKNKIDEIYTRRRTTALGESPSNSLARGSSSIEKPCNVTCEKWASQPSFRVRT